MSRIRPIVRSLTVPILSPSPRQCAICGGRYDAATTAERCTRCINPVSCAYCGDPVTVYRLDVDGEAFCSMSCNIKRQQYGNKLNETIHEKDRAQGAFWFGEE